GGGPERPAGPRPHAGAERPAARPLARATRPARHDRGGRPPPRDRPARPRLGGTPVGPRGRRAVPPRAGPHWRPTAMNSGSFLADTPEHPGDDGPRLVSAAGLEDTGDEAQAEFVRLSVAVGRLPWEGQDALPLTLRAEALRREHGVGWAAELIGLGVL